jgi:hypothetical protein
MILENSSVRELDRNKSVVVVSPISNVENNLPKRINKIR